MTVGWQTLLINYSAQPQNDIIPIITVTDVIIQCTSKQTQCSVYTAQIKENL